MVETKEYDLNKPTALPLSWALGGPTLGMTLSSYKTPHMKENCKILKAIYIKM